MRIRYLLLFVVASIFVCVSSFGQSQKDSLVRALTYEPAKRLSTYRNLADISHGTPDEAHYLERLYQEAKKNNNKKYLYESLSDQISIYLQKDSLETAKNYAELLEKSGPESETEVWLSHLRMLIFDAQLDVGADSEAIESEIENISEQNTANGSIYSQIEAAYKIGSSLFIHENPGSIQYLQTASELASKLPIDVGYKYQIVTLLRLAKAYDYVGCTAYMNRMVVTDEARKSVETKEKVLHLHESYYAMYYKENRPFFNIKTRLIQIYTSLLIANFMLSEEQTLYYLDKVKSLSENSNLDYDKYNYFLSFNNYYLSKGDYENALIMNDSLIRYSAKIAPYLLSSQYETYSRIQYKLGDYKAAYISLIRAGNVKDSLNLYTSQKLLDELQVKYDINKLNYEKTQLEVRNKQIMMIFLYITLFVVAAICLYLYLLFKREQKLKTELGKLSAKVTESERMKTAFVNSICHEIRTPLNAIIGFSDLMTPDITDDEREEFSGMLQKNAAMLISMINSMLEVSNLDVSEERLPCEPLDVCVLCIREMDRLQELYGKADIEYVLDLPQDGVMISTNEKYLSLILENIMENANKFTASGRITTTCRAKEGKVLISITDTGCGVAIEKQEAIFERFVKLNEFTPGSGLGLYLCRTIVRRLGGNIYIDQSYVDGGMRIVIELPM